MVDRLNRTAPSFQPSGTPPDDANARELKQKVGALVDDRFGGDYQKAFNAYDTNRDRAIDKPELQKLLGDAGVGNMFTRGAWADGIIDRFDKNANKKIEWSEFQNGIKPAR